MSLQVLLLVSHVLTNAQLSCTIKVGMLFFLLLLRCTWKLLKLTWIWCFSHWNPPAGRHQGCHLCLTAGPAAEWSGPAAPSTAARRRSVCLQEQAAAVTGTTAVVQKHAAKKWKCAYRAWGGSAAAQTTGEGRRRCGSGSSWFGQTSGWRSWSPHGPGGRQFTQVFTIFETHWLIRQEEAYNRTHSIKAFGQEKLVLVS